eukprot:4183162-Prymnesium_polylepis.1
MPTSASHMSWAQSASSTRASAFAHRASMPATSAVASQGPTHALQVDGLAVEVRRGARADGQLYAPGAHPERHGEVCSEAAALGPP